MKNSNDDPSPPLQPLSSPDEMLPEYDFSSAVPSVHARKRRDGYTTIVHRPDGRITQVETKPKRHLDEPSAEGHLVYWEILEVA